MMRACAAILLLMPMYIFQAQANYGAEIFEIGSNRQKKLFDMQVKELGQEGDLQRYQVTYSEPVNSASTGAVAFDEVGELNGSKVVKVTISQKQTNEDAVIEVKDGKIHFSLTQGGKTSVKTESLKEPFVVSANLQKFVRDNWADLKGGKTVSFRYGVWYRQDTVGFSLSKTRETADSVTLKMKPSSFIIAALVDPIDFTFAADGSRLLEMKGRVVPKIKKGDKYEDLDAEVVYKY